MYRPNQKYMYRLLQNAVFQINGQKWGEPGRAQNQPADGSARTTKFHNNVAPAAPSCPPSPYPHLPIIPFKLRIYFNSCGRVALPSQQARARFIKLRRLRRNGSGSLIDSIDIDGRGGSTCARAAPSHCWFNLWPSPSRPSRPQSITLG